MLLLRHKARGATLVFCPEHVLFARFNPHSGFAGTRFVGIPLRRSEENGMPHTPGNKRYEVWQEKDAGSFALNRCRDLLRLLSAEWPRRSRSVLAFNVGSGDVVDLLWESGFEVTGQDNDPELLAHAQKRLGARADFVLSAPDHLPFDDGFFDYAVAVAALEFWEDPEAVLREAGRIADRGFILIVPSSWSLFGLECRLRKKQPPFAASASLLQSPRAMARLLRRVYDNTARCWVSVLPGPTASWSENSRFVMFNKLPLPLPIGAFVGVRVDFGPIYTGTPILLRSSDPLPLS